MAATNVVELDYRGIFFHPHHGMTIPFKLSWSDKSWQPDKDVTFLSLEIAASNFTKCECNSPTTVSSANKASHGNGTIRTVKSLWAESIKSPTYLRMSVKTPVEDKRKRNTSISVFYV